MLPVLPLGAFSGVFYLLFTFVPLVGKVKMLLRIWVFVAGPFTISIVFIPIISIPDDFLIDWIDCSRRLRGVMKIVFSEILKLPIILLVRSRLFMIELGPACSDYLLSSVSPGSINKLSGIRLRDEATPHRFTVVSLLLAGTAPTRSLFSF